MTTNPPKVKTLFSTQLANILHDHGIYDLAELCGYVQRNGGGSDVEHVERAVGGWSGIGQKRIEQIARAIGQFTRPPHSDSGGGGCPPGEARPPGGNSAEGSESLLPPSRYQNIFFAFGVLIGIAAILAVQWYLGVLA